MNIQIKCLLCLKTLVWEMSRLINHWNSMVAILSEGKVIGTCKRKQQDQSYTKYYEISNGDKFWKLKKFCFGRGRNTECKLNIQSVYAFATQSLTLTQHRMTQPHKEFQLNNLYFVYSVLNACTLKLVRKLT